MLVDRRGASRNGFSREVKQIDQSVSTLRKDAAELRERANDYLLVWGGETYLVTSESHATGTDPRRDVVKTKYDAMVAELVSAREIVVPLLDRFKSLEKSSDSPAMRADVQQAQADTERATGHLDTALRQLDELKQLVQAKGH
jgi:hypothetical protein